MKQSTDGLLYVPGGGECWKMRRRKKVKEDEEVMVVEEVVI